MEREAAEEGLDPPDRAALVAAWRQSGWPGPLEPLHARLLWLGGYELTLGGAFVHGPAGPRQEWRWGSWQLARHRAAITRYLRHRADEAVLEHRYREERDR